MDAFGEAFGLGYDIGCGFEETIKRSPLGERAAALHFRMLVGAFHGHAHNRKCQLRFLTTYVKGLGLEDLEGCERLFSKSNALSKAVRYSSVFHRKQLIRTYLAHLDTFETYANLSKQCSITVTDYLLTRQRYFLGEQLQAGNRCSGHPGGAQLCHGTGGYQWA